MIISEEIFEVGSPGLIEEKIPEGFGNAEKLFATFSVLVGFPDAFPNDLEQLRIASQRAIRKNNVQVN